MTRTCNGRAVGAFAGGGNEGARDGFRRTGGVAAHSLAVSTALVVPSASLTRNMPG
jgi:hypothetical protein